MILHSTRLGELEVADEQIFCFSEGIPGFPEDKQFAYLPFDNADTPFVYLQSLHTPELTFLMTDPFQFFHDYVINLPDEASAQMGFDRENRPQVFTIITIPERTEEMTTNLLAPVLLNWRDKTGQQVILEKTPYTTRHRLFPNGFPKPETGASKEANHAGA